MKWGIAALLVLGLVALPVQGQTADSARVTVCAPPFPVASSASTGAGYINFCVYYPESVQPGEAFGVTGILTAPTTALPVFTAAASAFGPNGGGCTETTPTALVPTSNGVVGTQWTATSGFTMSAGSERCDFIAAASLTVGVTPLQIYTTTLTVNVRTENVRVDNFNFLCDAPAIAPNAYSTTGTTCNDSGLQAVADAITTLNRLRVQVCGSMGDVEAGDCPAWDQVANLTVGNQTNNVVVPDEYTVHNCGPKDNASPCTRVEGAVIFPVDGDNQPTGSFWVPVVLWFFALIYFLSRAKVFAGIACSVGIFVSIFLTGFGTWTQYAALLALAFAIWLEAIGRDKLYIKIFPKRGPPEPKLPT